MPDPVNTIVLLSGSGRTLENLIDKISSENLPININAVVSSRKDVRGLEVAEAANIDTNIFQRKKYSSVAEHNKAINNWISPYEPELILLAGYLCFYHLPEWFKGIALNIHPALLPKYGGKGFYGDRVHRAVLDNNDAVTGCTVHHVTDEYDAGSIVAQREVSVLPGDDIDTLAARVFDAECKLYPEAIRKVIADR
ncbi:MAG: phosphoribosylglycinamide formyltransferase [bacterium]|nr:phosphoribosylglycinamide formyltransferase [bacterium]MCP4799409.1 phosphoribosylglycinamide formyltransferase [bacterium]